MDEDWGVRHAFSSSSTDCTTTPDAPVSAVSWKVAAIICCYLTVKCFAWTQNFYLAIFMTLLTETVYWFAYSLWFIGRRSFQFRIADSEISATYISLLNSMANFSWYYPNSIAFYISDFVPYEVFFVFSAAFLSF